MSDPTTDALRKATRGLLYMSETDEPFHTFTWTKPPDFLQATRGPELGKPKPGAKVEQISLDDFFADLTEEQDWHGEEEKKTVERYRTLRQTIENELTDATVYRVGEVNIDIYIVGKTKTGALAGIQTKAVET